MTTTTAHLRSIVTLWPDLRDALGAPAVIGGFGLGLRGYLAGLEQYDHEEATTLRMLERDPAQIGERPIPIRLRVHDTMHLVRTVLLDCADAIAEHVQRDPIPMPPPRRAAYARTRAERLVWEDHARRVQAAQDDAADPRRWRHTGTRPDAPYTALWLLARVEGAPGPFRPLVEPQLRHVATVAAGAAERIERVLDIGSEVAELSVPCRKCGGTVDVHGGAGASPIGHCRGCGHIWAEGVIAA